MNKIETGNLREQYGSKISHQNKIEQSKASYESNQNDDAAPYIVSLLTVTFLIMLLASSVHLSVRTRVKR